MVPLILVPVKCTKSLPVQTINNYHVVSFKGIGNDDKDQNDDIVRLQMHENEK